MKLLNLLLVFCITFFSLDAATLRLLNVSSAPVTVRYRMPGESLQTVELDERHFADIPNAENAELLTVESADVTENVLMTVTRKIRDELGRDQQLEIFGLSAPLPFERVGRRGFEFNFEPLSDAVIRGNIKRDFSVWYDTFPALKAELSAHNVQPWQLFGAPANYQFDMRITPEYKDMRETFELLANVSTSAQERAHARDVVALLDAAYRCLSGCEEFRRMLDEKVYDIPSLGQEYFGESVRVSAATP
jgi:hypothetical protein